MDSTAFWFVDLTCEWQCDVDVLVSPNIELALNRKSHGLSPEAVLSTLRRLHGVGLIEFQRDGVPCDLAFGSCVYYGLTAPGGSAWEEIARPDWLRFLDDAEDRKPDGTWERIVQGADRARVDRCIAWPSDGSDVASLVRWELLRPWPATYWKTLPQGFRATADLRLKDWPLLRCGSAECERFLEERAATLQAYWEFHSWRKAVQRRP